MLGRKSGTLRLEDVDLELNGKAYTALSVTIDYEVTYTGHRYNHNCCADNDSEDEFECACSEWTITDIEVYDTEDRLADSSSYKDIENMLNSKMNISEMCEKDFVEHANF
jgi:hypothetical protein